MHASPEDIFRAITLLRAGKLVAFPTETVYGLGADALNAEAVAAVFACKGRPPSNPLIVHVSGEAMARGVCADWPAAAAILAERFWPGPLTLVLPRAPCVPENVAAGGPTVAVRCPSHPLTLALLETFGRPLVGPSANRSGQISPTCAEHVRDSFGEAEVFVLDGGPCTGGIESTVVDLTTNPVRILRPGLIDAEAIADALGSPVAAPPTEPAAGALGAPHRSPGLQQSHYAPAAPARLVRSTALAAAIEREHQQGGRVVIMGATARDVSPPHVWIEMPSTPERYAAELYSALRRADAARPALILIEIPWAGASPSGLWAAIADRLTRACAPRGG